MEKTYGRYQRRTNYYETDRMDIIHHSNYIRYFEESRIYWMEEIGLRFSEVEKMGILIPVMFVDCQYLVPVKFEDDIEIRVKLAYFDGIKMEFTYELYNKGTGQLCTTGRSGHCFLNDKMKPVLVKKQFPAVYDKMLKALARDGGVGRGKKA